ncbi:hypothetical protein B7494_g2350 [Chlorociboria aeruginascens]|nr:hypothetical protein B7494_g2350 [Chlorociboria aeruginascens]
MGKSKTLAQQIADLENPIPKDIDPEEDRPAHGSDEDNGSEDSDDGLAGTEHYVDVGKSRLRKKEEVALGPQYAGSRISREALNDDDNENNVDEDEDNEELDAGLEDAEEEEGEDRFAKPDDIDFEIDENDGDINSDEAFEEGDEEKFKGFTFRGSDHPNAVNGRKSRATAADFMSGSEEEQEDDNLEGSAEPETDEDILDVTQQHAENSEGLESGEEEDEEGVEQSDESDVESSKTSEDEDEDAEKSRRAEIRKLMSEEQQSVVATISQAAKADADKGNAVKAQRKAFDSLLNVRIRLQKALISTNSLSTLPEQESSDPTTEPYVAAEEAAIKLWNTLDSLRSTLSPNNGIKNGSKRKREIELSTPTSEIWGRMQDSEIANIEIRQSTIEKWSVKVRGASSVPTISRKLNPTAAQQSLTSLLQETLSKPSHLIKRTKIPRSCAPLQAKAKIIEDESIYDDADFYQLLLKELVDQRMADSTTSGGGGGGGRPMQWAAVKEAKTRKIVDRKASKGRKLRYTVHEKLQNFMAPEKRGSWEEEAVDRFFGTLLGKKMDLGEEDKMGVGEEEGGDREEEGLMLFRN